MLCVDEVDIKCAGMLQHVQNFIHMNKVLTEDAEGFEPRDCHIAARNVGKSF
jgi:hypothetical protein